MHAAAKSFRSNASLLFLTHLKTRARLVSGLFCHAITGCKTAFRLGHHVPAACACVFADFQPTDFIWAFTPTIFPCPDT
ncbi:hypothetical protein TMES_16925 [Thalassospira mesophila]|uniref:Uncharacterized protein n=1 Tax=Thalassospira mesophila TaxID=1293891 RepID=A0A1Y2KWZ7_9PROT|nr:hypothetical protein TMES_16925 [Thalassospira mesophila]